MGIGTTLMILNPKKGKAAPKGSGSFITAGVGALALGALKTAGGAVGSVAVKAAGIGLGNPHDREVFRPFHLRGRKSNPGRPDYRAAHGGYTVRIWEMDNGRAYYEILKGLDLLAYGEADSLETAKAEAVTYALKMRGRLDRSRIAGETGPTQRNPDPLLYGPAVPGRYLYRSLKKGAPSYWNNLGGVGILNTRAGHDHRIAELKREGRGQWTYRWQEIQPGDWDWPKGFKGNPRRPTREFMRRCTRGVGPGYSPGAVCAATWQRMSTAGKHKWLRRENPAAPSLRGTTGTCFICHKPIPKKEGAVYTHLGSMGRGVKFSWCKPCDERLGEARLDRLLGGIEKRILAREKQEDAAAKRQVAQAVKEQAEWLASKRAGNPDTAYNLKDLLPAKALAFARIIRGYHMKGRIPQEQYEAIARFLDERGRAERELRFFKAAAHLRGQSFHPSAVKWGNPAPRITIIKLSTGRYFLSVTDLEGQPWHSGEFASRREAQAAARLVQQGTPVPGGLTYSGKPRNLPAGGPRLGTGNPGKAWHRRQAAEYGRRLAGDLAAGHQDAADYWQGAESAEARAVAANPGASWHERRKWYLGNQARMARKLRRYRVAHEYEGAAQSEAFAEQVARGQAANPSRVEGARLKRLPNDPARSYRGFHGVPVKGGSRVMVPEGWPRKLWHFGTLAEMLVEVHPEGLLPRLRGGTLAGCPRNDRLFILGASPVYKPGIIGRASEIQYTVPGRSRREKATYVHTFDNPPQVKSLGGGYYVVTGQGLKLTRRGIVG